jgi:hypothetical protein
MLNQLCMKARSLDPSSQLEFLANTTSQECVSSYYWCTNLIGYQTNTNLGTQCSLWSPQNRGINIQNSGMSYPQTGIAEFLTGVNVVDCPALHVSKYSGLGQRGLRVAKLLKSNMVKPRLPRKYLCGTFTAHAAHVDVNQTFLVSLPALKSPNFFVLKRPQKCK